MEQIEITLKVNNKEHTLIVPTNYTLLRILREVLELTGTKEGCGEGECGACSVIMNNRIVPSCLVMASQADDSEIYTIESLEDEKGQLHPIQKAFIEEDAIQCGFCTPGMIMSTKYLIDNEEEINEDKVKLALSGNLCRCTGYKNIVNAAIKASKEIGGKK